ncbi:MAG: ABC transporter permease [Gammaproteobacteria bacterium]|nr:ABC transporter permease [Gammaproteobacteria bacterium]MBV9726774.1 ABC transporter permease [Gammaproteobacteria bacterium]
MSFNRQFVALLRMSLAASTQRLGSVLTILIGVTCAVTVLVSMLAMGSGARRQVLAGVHEDRVVVNSRGASGIESSIPREEADTVRDLPGIKLGAGGKPLVEFHAIVPIEARRRGTGRRIFFPLVGVTGSPTESDPELHLTEGRVFRAGLHELIASVPCVRQFSGFALGDKRPIGGADWTVVGHFQQGDTQQCVVLADAEILMSTFNTNTYTEATATLRSPADYARLQHALESNPSLHLEVRHEREAREEGIRQLNGLLNFAAYFVGAIMAIGATLGAVNSLYSMVDARRRELATLRAIGFGSGAVAASILCESMVLALPGALLGVLLARALFHRMAVSPFGFSFLLDVTPHLALTGVAWALAMGLIGGLLPAVRAVRVPVTTALRAA